MRGRGRWGAALLAVGLLAAACGDDDGGSEEADPVETTAADGGAEATTTTAVEDDLFGDDGGTDGADGESGEADGEDPCAGVTLEATDTGISEDTITVLVMADVGSELAPGLFQGSIDGVQAWAQAVNDAGGLACRDVEVIEWDSALNPTETTNGFLEACDNAIAMVGSSSLFVTDITALETCPDASGNEIGLPDIPERATAATHSCSPNVFSTGGSTGLCPYPGEGPRDYASPMGAHQWILENEFGGEPQTGMILIPSDLPTTIATGVATARALNNIGVETSGGEFGVSGRAEQATYGQFIQYMRDNGVTWAQTGSNDQSMIKWRKEAAAQGFDDTGVVWVCSLACYTADFIEQGGSDVEGTYAWLSFLPFAEADANEELATFLEYIGTDEPVSWSVGAWAAGRLFEQAVNEIVAAEGPNGITRQAMLDTLNVTTDFNANGLFGGLDISTRLASPCFVLLQVQEGEWARVHPEEPGTFDCEEGNRVLVEQLDAAAEFAG